MRDIDRRIRIDRRGFLRGSAAALPAAAVAAAGLTITPDCAWAQAAKNLKPATLATLAKAARDIYPHDSFPDSFYMAAVGPYDDKAADAKLRDLLEQGVAALDAESQQRNASRYIDVAWEDDRVAVLKAVETGAFFGKLRSDLVVTLYNQKQVWNRLGYEGASADKGGYLHRGFDDVDWLSNA